MLIIDGDGQHRPDDALRLVAQARRVRPGRSARARRRRRRPTARRLGNARAQLARQLPHRARDSRPDVGVPRRARREYLREFLHLLPNGFSTPTTTTLAFIKAGYNVDVRADGGAARASGKSKIRLARDGAKFLMIILKIVTIFSPLRVFLPISAACRSSLGVGYARLDRRDAAHDHQRRRCC